MLESDVDRALDFVLGRSGPSVDVFLESVFDFLSRYTDFYIVTDDPGAQGRGFKPGIAEKLVQRSFEKFKPQKNILPEEITVSNTIEVGTEPTNCPEDIRTENTPYIPTSDPPKEPLESSNHTSSTKKEESHSKLTSTQDADTFNGAKTKLYRWAQNQDDIDIRITFGDEVVNRSQLKVDISQKRLSVKLKNDEGIYADYIEGELFRKVDSSVSTWNFDRKKHELHIFLEKLKPSCWWKRLLVNVEDEKDLDLSKLDTTVYLHDLPPEEQATIDQLRYDQECKIKGLPTSKERKTQEILKKAWNAEGSPFAGKPFSPGDVHFN